MATAVKEATRSARDQTRATIFANAKPKSVVVEFFGTEIELRQPTLGAVLDLRSVRQAAADEGKPIDTKEAAVDNMLRYCYVPGTNEPVFEEADRDSLLRLPFGEDYTRITRALQDITGIKVTEAEKN